MKAKTMKSTIVVSAVALAVFCGLKGFESISSANDSDSSLLLANVEALTQGDIEGKYCSTSSTYVNTVINTPCGKSGFVGMQYSCKSGEFKSCISGSCGTSYSCSRPAQNINTVRRESCE